MSADPAQDVDALVRQAAAKLVDAAGGGAGAGPWGETRQGFVHLFRTSGDSSPETVARRLDGTAEKVGRATGAEREQLRRDEAAIWRTRLADLVEVNPDVAAELSALVGGGADAGGSPTIHGQSYDQSTMIIAPGGTVYLNTDGNRGR